MAMTPEGKVKKQVVDLLKQWGAYYFFPVTGGYGRSGVPDIIACIGGDFIAIECKAGTNRPTQLQKRNLDLIGVAGGWPWEINEDDIQEFRSWLTSRYGDPGKWDKAIQVAVDWFTNRTDKESQRIATALTAGAPRSAKKTTKKSVKKAVKKVAK